MESEQHKSYERDYTTESLGIEPMCDAQPEGDPLDELLLNRANHSSELPWLPLKIENQLAARAKARMWMDEHRGSLRLSLSEWLRRPSLNARALAITGAGGSIAGLVYMIGQLPLAAPVVSQLGALPLALLAGAISALAVSWPSLKHYYW